MPQDTVKDIKTIATDNPAFGGANLDELYSTNQFRPPHQRRARRAEAA